MGTLKSEMNPTISAATRAQGSRCSKPHPAKKPTADLNQEQSAYGGQQRTQPDADFRRWSLMHAKRVSEDGVRDNHHRDAAHRSERRVGHPENADQPNVLLYTIATICRRTSTGLPQRAHVC